MKTLEIDPLRAIPADDVEPTETVKTKPAEGESTEGTVDTEAEDTTATAAGPDDEDDDDDEDDVDAADIEAYLASESNAIPKGRFDEVNNELKLTRQQLQEQANRLATIEAARVKEAAPKARDFAAELKDAKLKFTDGDISADEYEELRDQIVEARLEAKLEAKINPLAQTVKDREQRAALAETQAQLDTVAARAFAKYPFLDHQSDDKDDEAIAAVKAQRAELEADGMHPAKALDLAVKIVAPAYVTADNSSTAVDPAEIARQRKLKARKALIEAVDGTPPNISRTGVGTKVTDNKVQIGRGVEDHERWLNIPEQERDKRIVAVG